MSYKTLGGGDPFKTKIYKEFEENLYRVLDISLADFIRIFEGDREPSIEAFSEIYLVKALWVKRNKRQNPIANQHLRSRVSR